jgi:hypothetical protein
MAPSLTESRRRFCTLKKKNVNSPAKTGIDHVSTVTAYGPLEFKNCTDPIFADPHYFIIRPDYDANRATHPTELHVTQVSDYCQPGHAAASNRAACDAGDYH